MSHKVYTALGLMSGTSLDGVDAVIIRTDGMKIYAFEQAIDQSYSSLEKEELAQGISQALTWNFSGPKPNSLSRIQDIIDHAHLNVSAEIIWRREAENCDDDGNWDPDIDIIGYHGQTVAHAPDIGETLQIGDGQLFADKFGIPCVFDFRSADVASGGEGAPLAPIYHKALCEYSSLKGNTVVLNLGGVSNFTWVGEGPLMASDTGPANGPLDSWLNHHGHDYDADGRISAQGRVDFALIENWLAAPFFQRRTPKSADRYDFDVFEALKEKSLEDGAATLAAFCALSVKKTLGQLTDQPDRIIVCGGGRKNKTIMNMLRAEMDCPVKTAEDVSWRGDFIEAEAFAYLAVRSLLGLPLSFPETTGVSAPMSGGQIAYPK